MLDINQYQVVVYIMASLGHPWSVLARFLSPKPYTTYTTSYITCTTTSTT